MQGRQKGSGFVLWSTRHDLGAERIKDLPMAVIGRYCTQLFAVTQQHVGHLKSITTVAVQRRSVIVEFDSMRRVDALHIRQR